MTQADRDRLVTLKKAKKKLITQEEAAEELGVSTRQVKRLLQALKKRGDKAVIHGLRGKPSNRRIPEAKEKEAVKTLSAEVYQDFGPTLAAEHLRKRHGIEASKETVRQWMIRGKLWRAKREKVKKVYAWRPRRSRFGELVQWDTSTHDWLEGRGETVYLIAMIDDATSRLFARFVRHDSSEENMKLVWSYVEKFGRPIAFYTDKASLFQTAEKRKRDEPGVEKDAVEMAADANRPCLAGTGDHLDSGAFSAGQRTGGAEFQDGPGSAGQRAASGRGENHRAGQPISPGRLPGVVESGIDGGAGQSRRCPSAVGQEP